jgi:protein SERAC1
VVWLISGGLGRCKSQSHRCRIREAYLTTLEQEMGRPLVFIGHSMGGLVAKAVSSQKFRIQKWTRHWPIRKAAVAASSAQVTQANDLDKLYKSIKGFVFFGTPHGGSAALGKMRVHVLKRMAKAAFTEIPPKLEQALQTGSDELLDLADEFRKISLYVEGQLIIASYYEQVATLGLGARVRMLWFDPALIEAPANGL